MGYIPKKLTNPGLYATGDNFLDESTGKVYVGPYHANFNGSLFSGVDPFDPNKAPLIPNPNKVPPKPTRVVSTPQNNAYNEIKGNTKTESLIKYGRDPENFTPIPTEQDYARGNITRYFAKRITEKPSRIKEISQQSYNSLLSKDGKYNYAIWREYKIIWRISGSQQQIESTNRKIVDRANKTFKGIRAYLRNLSQFYRVPEEEPTPIRTFRDEPRQPSIRRNGNGGGGPRRIPPELY